eukprot:9493993-Pyramimonas_sp.AAC.1
MMRRRPPACPQRSDSSEGGSYWKSWGGQEEGWESERVSRPIQKRCTTTTVQEERKEQGWEGLNRVCTTIRRCNDGSLMC